MPLENSGWRPADASPNHTSNLLRFHQHLPQISFAAVTFANDDAALEANHQDCAGHQYIEWAIKLVNRQVEPSRRREHAD